MQPSVDECRQGVVKSFSKCNGYGFIRLRNQTDDIYFKSEDLTPRARKRMEGLPSITGAEITCTHECFGTARVRARCVRFMSKSSAEAMSGTATADHDAAVSKEPSRRVVRPVQKVSTSIPASRPRGWGDSKKAELIAMGFSEEAAKAAIARGLDVNEALDSLLSGDLESLPTTRDGSETASDHDISSTDKSMNSEEQDEESKPHAVETAWEASPAHAEPERPASPVAAASEADAAVDEQKECDRPAAASDEVAATAGVHEDSSEAETTTVRQLARVVGDWSSDGSDPNLLPVQQGTVIYTWSGTATDNGWIYAERLNMGSRKGWIPTNVLHMLPLRYEWRRISKSCKSFSDDHLAGEQGEILFVDAQSSEQGSDEGWIYSERLDGSRAGFFPASALEQLSVSLRWISANRSQQSQHETQACVEAGDMFLVDPDSCTKEGWAYAWTVDRHPANSAESPTTAGWVPINCLDWDQE